jgi:hypothetical protein
MPFAPRYSVLKVYLRKSCCVYFNPQNEQLWIIDYRIYDPDTDKKIKIDHVEEMIHAWP